MAFKLKRMITAGMTTLALMMMLSGCGSDNDITTPNNTAQQTATTVESDAGVNLKQTAAQFLNAINERDVATLEALVREDYIQHNPFIGDGRDAFVSLLPVLEQYNTRVENIRALEDGNFVALHNRWRNAEPFGSPEMVAFDVLRFDENGKIAEHWDALMPSTPPNRSGRVLFDGATLITDLNLTQENKQKATALFSTLINGTPSEVFAAVNTYFEPNFIQHNSIGADGISAVFEAFAQEQWVYLTNHKIIGEGNFVLSISEGTAQGAPTAFYDLLRFENGLIAEHWDIIQTIPTENLANNNTMFNFP